MWEFAARFGRFGDWRNARKHYADRAGVKLPGGTSIAHAIIEEWFGEPITDGLW